MGSVDTSAAFAAPGSAAHQLDLVCPVPGLAAYAGAIRGPSPPQDGSLAGCEALLAAQGKLQAWLRGNVPAIPADQGLSAKQFSLGQSNPTFLLQASPSSAGQAFSRPAQRLVAVSGSAAWPQVVCWLLAERCW